MLDQMHQMETVAAIQEGMASAERGELKPASHVLAEMQAKYGLAVILSVLAKSEAYPRFRPNAYRATGLK